ncbi:MAG: AmmeMemoRadiSam system protein B [Spirochaetales bacterium]|nr:AmmeMemoRadiSam system protein B [Spirochaetales bacterium]
MRKAKLIAAPAAVCFVLTLWVACERRADSGGISYVGSCYLANKIPSAPVNRNRFPKTTPLPPGAIPWAGTVSHHLLAADVIGEWFAELRRSRDVSLFVIVSPRHFVEGVKDVSLSSLPWSTKDGPVAVARGPLDRLKRELNISEDPTAFPGEHGIAAVVPFVRRYFPKAEILPVIVTESPLSTERADRLASALRTVLTEEDRARWFLVVSTDFSHHGDAAQTEERRRRSLRFFAAVGLETWPYATCDNMTGMRVLARLAEQFGRRRASIFAYTDSYRLSGQDPGDITSYFFSFIY